jgi:hypothetical protein
MRGSYLYVFIFTVYPRGTGLELEPSQSKGAKRFPWCEAYIVFFILLLQDDLNEMKKYKPGGDNGSACGKKGSANS